MKRTEAPSASGRTPIFDFDEWNSQHYGQAFQRSQAARKRYFDKPINAARDSNNIKYEIIIFGGMALMTVILYLIMRYDSTNTDIVIDKSKER